MKDKIIALGVICILIVFGVWYTFYGKPAQQISQNDKTVVFMCDASKSITATFHLPSDTNVSLVLSDGRNMDVPHAISASGARYANADESFVFWNKGDTAFVIEGIGSNSTTTFTNCVLNDTAHAGTDTVLKTYTNDQYGFEITYPNTLVATTTFTNSYTLQNQWRVEALSNTTGTPVISIPVFMVNQGGVATGKAYPLFFDALIRIGVSSAPNDVASCLKPNANYTNQPVTTVTIHGVQFKKFSFQDAAMMKYVQGESYRTVHNGICYAIEQVKTGSSYRDETMKPGIPEDVLNGYYDLAGSIIQSFEFTK